MSGLPAQCPKCGLLWTSNAVAVYEAAGVVMSNNTVSCPGCGARSRLAEGQFSFDAAGTPSIVSAPPTTHEMFARIYRVLRDKSVSQVDIAALADIANRATAGDLTVEAAAAAATAVNDRFAGIFRGRRPVGWP